MQNIQSGFYFFYSLNVHVTADLRQIIDNLTALIADENSVSIISYIDKEVLSEVWKAYTYSSSLKDYKFNNIILSL